VNIGILGGSFDPPHLGHVLLAAYALASAELDRLLVVPVYQHALHKHLAPFEQRLRMCELAFQQLKHVEISTLERDLGGTSRSLRLVEAVAAQNPGATLRLVVGADILLEAHRWQAFDEVRRRAPLLVVGRAGVDCPELDPRAPVLPDISSTDIRTALARGDSALAWLTPSVSAHALAQRLYADTP
jgi:nicotinate-nucleotide adenylyltransferase